MYVIRVFKLEDYFNLLIKNTPANAMIIITPSIILLEHVPHNIKSHNCILYTRDTFYGMVKHMFIL